MKRALHLLALEALQHEQRRADHVRRFAKVLPVELRGDGAIEVTSMKHHLGANLAPQGSLYLFEPVVGMLP